MYSVWFSEKSKKELSKLPKNIQEVILNKVNSIRHEPLRYLKKLEGSKLWRLRIMDYRTIIDVIITENKIIILTIDKRSKVYDR